MPTMLPANEASISYEMLALRSLGLGLYAWVLAGLLITWASTMTLVSGRPWFEARWQMSLPMAFVAFVAGVTPAGGASVAFPVFIFI
ncbi:hypothetical protein N9260_00890, partial [bacterium]|nr:hypothetical protein [bacterium]